MPREQGNSIFLVHQLHRLFSRGHVVDCRGLRVNVIESSSKAIVEVGIHMSSGPDQDGSGQVKKRDGRSPCCGVLVLKECVEGALI